MDDNYKRSRSITDLMLSILLFLLPSSFLCRLRLVIMLNYCLNLGDRRSPLGGILMRASTMNRLWMMSFGVRYVPSFVSILNRDDRQELTSMFFQDGIHWDAHRIG